MANKKKAVKKAAKKVVAKKSPAKKVVKKAAAKKVTKKIVTKSASKKSVKKVAKKTATKAPIKKIAKPIGNASAVAAKKPALKNIDYSKAITPLGDRLVIRVVQGEKMTAGGLIIPDMVSAAIGHLKGEVLASGHGGKNKKGMVRPLDVQVGDLVLFAEYAGTKVEFSGEELQIIHESDVMGVVQK